MSPRVWKRARWQRPAGGTRHHWKRLRPATFDHHETLGRRSVVALNERVGNSSASSLRAYRSVATNFWLGVRREEDEYPFIPIPVSDLVH